MRIHIDEYCKRTYMRAHIERERETERKEEEE
jgi:hypothetical protein